MASVEYLLRHISSADGVPIDPSQRGSALTRYYAADGYPPGRWTGTGLAGINKGAGIDVDQPITEEQMRRLFERGEDPVTGQQLARKAPAKYATRQERIDRRISKLPATMPAATRTAHIARIKDEERKKPTRNPVAGFDITFSVPKSVSVLWALGDHGVQVQLYEAHQEAIQEVLHMIEDETLRTRTGTNGVQQVRTNGMLGAIWDHWDSRAGDPQLHSHVTIPNRVQSAIDGKWRTLDSRALYRSTVAMSERYNLLLADAVSRRLGLTWQLAERGPNRRPSRELAVVPRQLSEHFSQRSAAIEPAVDQAIADWTEKHGRRPSQAIINKLRQTVTLDTRTAKHHHTLQTMTARWQQQSSALLGLDSNAWAAHAATADPEHRPVFLTAGDIDPDWLRQAGAQVLHQTSATRSSWTYWNLDSQTGKLLAGQNLHFATSADLAAVQSAITATAQALSIDLSAPVLAHTPDKFIDAKSGRSQFLGAAVFTSRAIIDAEARLLAGTADTSAPAVDIEIATAVASSPLPDGRQLYDEDQAPAAIAITTSGRRIDLLLGPAGTGKTTSMAGVCAIWQAEHGPGSVVGLATSTKAATVLGDELGIGTENTAKWLAESALHQDRTDRLNRLTAARTNRIGQHSDPARIARLDAAISRAQADIDRWSLHPGQLLIVDEAGMAGTLALDRLATQAADAGAKLLLVGDPHQLAAVETGGVLGLLAAARADTPTLTQIRRFRDPDGTRRTWEEEASADMRLGLHHCLDSYEEHDRFTDGPASDMLAAAYEAWRFDTARGNVSLLIAADNATVSALNQQARAELVALGHVEAAGVALADGLTAGRGDRIVTREIDRVLTDGSGHGRIISARTGKRDAGFVQNGQQWQVQQSMPDGSLTVRLLNSAGKPTGRPVTLPAGYVAEHVQLSYATTAHRSQGLTVDTAHVIAPPTISREAFYVAMTRGRLANHGYVPTDTPPAGADPLSDHNHGSADAATARTVLQSILDNSSADISAHQTMTEQLEQAESIRQLAAEYETIAADAHQGTTEDTLYEVSVHTDIDTEAVLDDPAADDLHRAVRAARRNGLPVDQALASIVAGLPETGRTATGIAEATRAWTIAVAAGRTVPPKQWIAGLIPTADQGLTDPATILALTERAQLIEARADAVLHRAEQHHAAWLRPLLQHRPTETQGAAQWRQAARIIAAYRDRWSLTDDEHTATLGPMPPPGEAWAQVADRRHAEHAAAAITSSIGTAPGQPAVEVTATRARS
ncbi:conjugative relaxase-like TrwC/TraI family protein [Nakamurella sp. UYEF19]|uniref:MobF family relaxase n=1 Tax=Nakamurella sp. UYEF19 TaxID=1756392 RepID=UPI003393DEA2